MSILPVLSEIYKISLKVIIFFMRSGGIMILSPLADAGGRGNGEGGIINRISNLCWPNGYHHVQQGNNNYTVKAPKQSNL